MALRFDPSPYLQVWQQRRAEEESMRPDISGSVTNPLLQGLQMMNENRRQQRLMELQKQQMDMTAQGELQEQEYKYGKPIDPDVMIGQQGGQGASRLFNQGQPMQTGQPSRLIDAFNKFRSGGMKPAEARPEFMEAMGEKERNAFYDSTSPGNMADVEYKRAQTAKLNREAMGGMAGEKPPPGYRWSADGSRLEAIPGGPAEFKQQQSTEKQELIDQSLENRATLVIQKVDQALKNVNSFSTGGMSFTKSVPFVGQATGAVNLDADLDTIKALLGFEQLEQMKSQSKAGASGLGPLSDHEMRLLTAARANLEQAQTPAQLQQRLGEVKTHFQNWLQMERGINPYEQGQDSPGNNQGADQMITVSNGRETLRIPASDLAEAAADGYGRVQ